jgi:hypothetical protein
LQHLQGAPTSTAVVDVATTTACKRSSNRPRRTLPARGELIAQEIAASSTRTDQPAQYVVIVGAMLGPVLPPPDESGRPNPIMCHQYGAT